MDTPEALENGVCILSFDGGGPGSISQLIFIKEFLRRIEFDLDLDEDTLRPADYWDLMGGVGFGGLCALLLGRLGMSVLDAMDELARIGNAIFPQDVSEIATPEGNLAILKEAIEAMLRRHEFPVDIKLNDKALQGSRCQVVIFAASPSVTDHCHRFRTYRSRHSELPCTFVEAACATLAIPPYFAPVPIGPTRAERRFIGTPLGFNNPIRQVLEEARSKFGDERKVALILSLGSGRPAARSLETRLPTIDSLHNLLISAVLDCEKAARELPGALLQSKAYLRLNADQGMENIKISDWNKLGCISEHTDVYLHKPDIESSIDVCSRFLRERNAWISLGQLDWSGTAISARSNSQHHGSHLVLSATGVKQMRDIMQNVIHGVTLLDAIGNRVQIPMEWCRTYSMFEDLIRCYFKHQKPPGAILVGRGEYKLVHGENVIDPARWTYELKSGYTVEMSMVLRRRNEYAVICPRCGTWFYGKAINGSSCSGRFQVEAKSSDEYALVSAASQSVIMDRTALSVAENGSGDDGLEQFRLISVVDVIDVSHSLLLILIAC